MKQRRRRKADRPVLVGALRGLFSGRHEPLDGGREVAAPVLLSHHRPHAVTFAGVTAGCRLGHGRIVPAQAAVLFLLLVCSLALIVEELAIAAGAGGHGMPPWCWWGSRA